MAGGAGSVLLRVSTPEDFPQLSQFNCARPGDKPALAAQQLIRRAPEMVSEGDLAAEIVVAADGDIVIGVAVYGLETPTTPHATIYSLGVVLNRQRQGHGTALKRAVMAEVAQRDGWPNVVASEVHRTNFKMIGLNDKLNVRRTQDPSDGEYLLCAVAVEVD